MSQMRQAADQLLPKLIRDRERLRNERQSRRQAARDPRELGRFDQPDSLDPFANLSLYMGGTPGWGGEHRKNDYARLRQIVAFPDWYNPASAWDSLVTAYLTAFEAESPWVLTLSAAPLTGPEVNRLLRDYLLLHDPGASLPKFRLILGSLSDVDRRSLIQQADAYVPLEGPYHLDGVEGGRYVTQLDALATLLRT